MQIEYATRGYELNDEVRQYTERRLAKVLRFLHEPLEVRVTLEEEKHRRIAEIHVSHRFGILQANEEGTEMLSAIHQATDKVSKQARRSTQKFKDRRRRADRHQVLEWPVDVLEEGSLEAESSPRIIKSTRLQIKPMSLDEAALQLDESRNEFVVFRDASTDRVNVLYRRKDRNYGLISPDL